MRGNGNLSAMRNEQHKMGCVQHHCYLMPCLGQPPPSLSTAGPHSSQQCVASLYPPPPPCTCCLPSFTGWSTSRCRGKKYAHKGTEVRSLLFHCVIPLHHDLVLNQPTFAAWVSCGVAPVCHSWPLLCICLGSLCVSFVSPSPPRAVRLAPHVDGTGAAWWLNRDCEHLGSLASVASPPS